jgi:hypothetical protein
MSWENELKEEIRFTSPSGKEFSALWRDNPRSFERKLGQFNPPSFSGTVVQDLGPKSWLYPLTFYFDGPFHNKTANEFTDALYNESGQWEVIHPVKGPLGLQLVSIKELISPVENGNYTAFESEWIEPANQTRIISVEETITTLLSSIIGAIEDGFLIAQQLKSDIYSGIQAVLNTFNAIVNFMDTITRELASLNAIVLDAYDSARSSFDNAIDTFDKDNFSESINAVFEQVVNLSLAPLAATSDFMSRFNANLELIESIIDLAPATVTDDDYNTVITQEMGVTVALIAIAQIVATSEFSSRADVIAAIDNLTNIFNDTISALDEIQDGFSGLYIDQQYFSQTKTYTGLMNIYALSIQALMKIFLSIKAEKRFTLARPRSPLEITVTEYGSLGENDENYDLFIKSNQLSGNDILLLPAGREVVVYVG